MFSSIAMGIIQLLCLRYQDDIQVSIFWYLRTPSTRIMSEASMTAYLRRNLFRFMALQGGLTITKIISGKQVALETEDIDRLISWENF